jgi:hypothetical protein
MTRWMTATTLAACCVALVIGRLALYLWIQFPAPVGDGALFLSVSLYRCRTGIFSTPLFPLDPTGADRYIWHGIGHPALLSALNPGCGAEGAFVALSVIMAVTFAVAFFGLRTRVGAPVALFVAASVFALQAKQGFRPETTAIAVVLGAEVLRWHRRVPAWIVCGSLLGWVQPSCLILYLPYALLSARRQEFADAVHSWKLWLPAAALVNLAILIAYPFPIVDLLQGLATQGRNWIGWHEAGSIATYWIRSDFFPLFGAVFVAVYLLAAVGNRKLLLLAPLIWFYGVRVPETYYNVVPLFVALLVSVLPASGVRAATVTAVLALAGLAQSEARDIVSLVRYDATMQVSAARFDALVSAGAVPCRVPYFFTMFEPASFFESAFHPMARACRQQRDGRHVDFLQANGRADSTTGRLCTPWPLASTRMEGTPFQSDSGYSWIVCELPGQ